jgi:hypothetical protein
VDENEAARRAAEEKAAALHYLGFEVGAGATVSARAVEDNLALHEEARQRIPTPRNEREHPLETWERLYASAFVIVIAMDQILSYADRVLALTSDVELKEARDEFDNTARDTETLRDLVAHLEAYAVGEGWRQTGKSKKLPPITERNLATLMWWPNGGGTTLRVGEEGVDLRSAAVQAVELAKTVEKVRVRHLELAGREAKAAFLRQHPVESD